jgi:ribosomal protein L35
MTNNKGIKKRFKCQLCRTVIWTEKEFLKHLLTHFDGERCPICNMKAKRKTLHLAEYHVYPNKLLILERDLAILVKESGDFSILKDPQFGLTDQEIKTIKRLAKIL